MDSAWPLRHVALSGDLDEMRRKKGNCWPELLDFYHPGGAEQITAAVALCGEHLLSCKKEVLRIDAPVPAIPLHSHQGEREKNEYS